MSRRTHALMLWCAALDRTFSLAELQGETVLVGKCIHCNTQVVLSLEGRKIRGATLEHIVPQTHGGTNDLENLAIACGGCNGGKGIRLDVRDWNDPKLQEVIARLKERRTARLREPLKGLVLPVLATTEETSEEETEVEEESKEKSRGRGGRRKKRGG